MTYRLPREYRLQDDDLNIQFLGRYNNNQPLITDFYSPSWVRYSVGRIDSDTGDFIPVGSTFRIPVELKTGVYRPNFVIKESWLPGDYEMRWFYKVMESSDMEEVVVPFSVLFDGISPPPNKTAYRDLIAVVVSGGPYPYPVL